MADNEMQAPHPQCPQEICGRHQGRGACTLCESLEERDRFVAPFRWFIWEFSGAHAIWRKVVPPDPTDETTQRNPPTFFLWFVALYAGVFGLVSQRYENRLDRLENRANSIYTQLGTDNWQTALELIPRTQRKRLPVEPEFWDPVSIYYSLAGKKRTNGDIVGDLKRVIETFAQPRKAKKALAGVRLYGANLQEVVLIGANLQEADLSEAMNLMQSQLDKACADKTTKLPKLQEGLAPNMSPEQRKLCAALWSDSFKQKP